MISCLLVTDLMSKKYSPLEVKHLGLGSPSSSSDDMNNTVLKRWFSITESGLRPHAMFTNFISSFIQLAIRAESHILTMGSQNDVILPYRLLGGTLSFWKSQIIMSNYPIIKRPCTSNPLTFIDVYI